MIAELIVSYAFVSNEPMYLRSGSSPYIDTEIRLEVHQPIWERSYLNLKPYLLRSQRENVNGRVGAIVEIGMSFDGFDVELFHHSGHDLDLANSGPLEVDGIRLRIKLN